MQIKQTFTINTSAETVWAILGHQFDRVSEWASGVYASHGRNTGTVLLGAPSSGRICDTKLGPFKETITQYDEERRILAYTAQGDNMPFFVKGMSNTWTVTPLGQHQAQVEMRMEASLLPVFSLVMGPLMRIQLGGVLKEIQTEMKYFAETGMPHPRKVKAKQLQLKTAA